MSKTRTLIIPTDQPGIPPKHQYYFDADVLQFVLFPELPTEKAKNKFLINFAYALRRENKSSSEIAYITNIAYDSQNKNKNIYTYDYLNVEGEMSVRSNLKVDLAGDYLAEVTHLPGSKELPEEFKKWQEGYQTEHKQVDNRLKKIVHDYIASSKEPPIPKDKNKQYELYKNFIAIDEDENATVDQELKRGLVNTIYFCALAYNSDIWDENPNGYFRSNTIAEYRKEKLKHTETKFLTFFSKDDLIQIQYLGLEVFLKIKRESLKTFKLDVSKLQINVDKKLSQTPLIEWPIEDLQKVFEKVLGKTDTSYGASSSANAALHIYRQKLNDLLKQTFELTEDPLPDPKKGSWVDWYYAKTNIKVNKETLTPIAKKRKNTHKTTIAKITDGETFQEKDQIKKTDSTESTFSIRQIDTGEYKVEVNTSIVGDDAQDSHENFQETISLLKKDLETIGNKAKQVTVDIGTLLAGARSTKTQIETNFVYLSALNNDFEIYKKNINELVTQTIDNLTKENDLALQTFLKISPEIIGFDIAVETYNSHRESGAKLNPINKETLEAFVLTAKKFVKPVGNEKTEAKQSDAEIQNNDLKFPDKDAAEAKLKILQEVLNTIDECIKTTNAINEEVKRFAEPKPISAIENCETLDSNFIDSITTTSEEKKEYFQQLQSTIKPSTIPAGVLTDFHDAVTKQLDAKKAELKKLEDKILVEQQNNLTIATAHIVINSLIAVNNNSKKSRSISTALKDIFNIITNPQYADWFTDAAIAEKLLDALKPASSKLNKIDAGFFTQFSAIDLPPKEASVKGLIEKQTQTIPNVSTKLLRKDDLNPQKFLKQSIDKTPAQQPKAKPASSFWQRHREKIIVCAVIFAVIGIAVASVFTFGIAGGVAAVVAGVVGGVGGAIVGTGVGVTVGLVEDKSSSASSETSASKIAKPKGNNDRPTTLKDNDRDQGPSTQPQQQKESVLDHDLPGETPTIASTHERDTSNSTPKLKSEPLTVPRATEIEEVKDFVNKILQHRIDKFDTTKINADLENLKQGYKFKTFSQFNLYKQAMGAHKIGKLDEFISHNAQSLGIKTNNSSTQFKPKRPQQLQQTQATQHTNSPRN